LQKEKLLFIGERAYRKYMLTRSPELYQAKILVIDDEALNLAILEELFDAAGYHNVTYESSPFEALKHYKADHFDLVLLDLNMPDKSGFEVMEAFEAANILLPPPVLVLTALNDKATKIEALNRGASDFLTKPFDHEEVIIRSRNLVALQFAHKKLQSQNTLCEAKVKKRTEQLNLANLDAIYRLGLVADFRDTDTSDHTKRVGILSQRLGFFLGLGEPFCERLLHASPMHDIGKVGIPDDILLKPGRLDENECEVMKGHSAIGAKILEGSSSAILKLAAEIAQTHHERWDGTGYPTGLAGNNIPIAGRIVMVADVFDALSSDRPYKQAWSPERIKQYMVEQKGVMFDPDVIECFCTHYDEIVNGVGAALNQENSI